jgi:hypothetical protein
MPEAKDPVLAEAERDVRELEQYVADQHIRVNDLLATGRDDDETKAREGLFLLADALEIARRRLRAERETRGIECQRPLGPINREPKPS